MAQEIKLFLYILCLYILYIWQTFNLAYLSLPVNLYRVNLLTLLTKHNYIRVHTKQTDKKLYLHQCNHHSIATRMRSSIIKYSPTTTLL